MQLVVANITSIDGVIQSPLSADEDSEGGFAHGGWVASSEDADVADFMRNTTVSAQGMLLGRRTYTILTDAWSDADPREPAVSAMNTMPKYVVSRSPETLRWSNSHRVDGADVAAAVRRLKEGSTGELLVLGSGMLVAELAEHDLIDEYRLLVFPVVIGAGKRMFGAEAQLAHFALTGTVTTHSGVVILTYGRSR